MPMIDIQEVGTGGGSIARVEDGGALRVGPRERRRRARPGLLRARRHASRPITDANLLLGRLGADRFLGGEMKLDLAAAETAHARNGSPSRSGSSVTEAADGILRIATTKMSYAVQWVTTERGLDAGSFRAGRLWRRGSAACRGGRARARHPHGHHPARPGHFSAFGMLFADLRRDFVRTWFTPLADARFRGHGDDLSRD